MSLPPLSELDRRRLRWRARRGLLENDLLIQRFLDRHEAALDTEQVEGLVQLLELPDNDLLDLLLARSPLPAACNTPAARRVLTQLQST
jgi:antitoxin CptB